MKKGKLIAVVPVRAGSQRVKDKNINHSLILIC